MAATAAPRRRFAALAAVPRFDRARLRGRLPAGAVFLSWGLLP
ncbi:hypothetical protein [Kitasatospora cathayae]|uniref:Uncharacterized protein n=1 Tax=Kitasatospora cathayae TaxID=3004092 RepID=A0ABY7Q5J2_9ACTN|nr:hypothetical protein [Kitasatospora sp. HUAS 3-15]WBP87802.1 hypothetical protein O1G21_19425 [Kitasatospora sp. HUAS 3-15]